MAITSRFEHIILGQFSYGGLVEKQKGFRPVPERTSRRTVLPRTRAPSLAIGLLVIPASRSRSSGICISIICVPEYHPWHWLRLGGVFQGAGLELTVELWGGGVGDSEAECPFSVPAKHRRSAHFRIRSTRVAACIVARPRTLSNPSWWISSLAWGLGCSFLHSSGAGLHLCGVPEK